MMAGFLTGMIQCLMISLFLTGCQPMDSKARSEILNELGELYSIYLDQDIEKARRSLHDSISIIKTADFQKLGASEHGLWLDYSRLYALETRANNENLADGYFLKARYYYLKKLELGGKSTEEAMTIVREFTAERCIEIVDEFDKKRTEGRGPAFVRQLLRNDARIGDE